MPVEMLAEGPAAEQAEAAWNDDVLIWGRKGWGQVARLCRWARDIGADLPSGWCEP